MAERREKMGYLLEVLFYVAIVLGALGVLYLIADSIVFINAVNYGVVWRFGGQTKGTRKEGLNLKFPIVEKIKTVSLELKTKEIKVEFTTKDNLRLTIPGSIQYRADSHVLDGDDKNVFVRVSDEAVAKGIERDIQAKLGGIGGQYGGEDFIKNRQALDSIINSILRLDNPLHLTYDFASCEKKSCSFCKKQSNKKGIDKGIMADQLINFYNTHWKPVKELLDHENDPENINNRSNLEKRYGIDIVKYSLAEISFTEETQGAQEERKQAEYRAQAGIKIIKLAEQAKSSSPDISSQQALNWADSILNPDTPRTMISVEGDSGILGGLLGLIPKEKGKGGGK